MTPRPPTPSERRFLLILGTTVVPVLAALSLEGFLPGWASPASRWITGDRGDLIPYVIDAAALPTGISLTQAVAAVSNAFQAWADASSLRFRFEGFQELGTSAPSISTNDGRIRVQLHDLWNYLPVNVVGYGSPTFQPASTNGVPLPGRGGRVGTNVFDKIVSAGVIIDHTHWMLEGNTSALAKVLCHEIGHGLGLDHSSETYPEPDPLLSGAAMYFLTVDDGQGARLNAWDIQTAQQAYPTGNTPPYGEDRVMDILTATPQWTPTTGVNQVQIRGLDRQQDSLVPAIAALTTNYGLWSLTGGLLSYVPRQEYSDQLRLDPALSGYYDVCYVSLADAANLSAYLCVRVVSYSLDRTPRDTLPDTWANRYGVTAGYADADGDGFVNLIEWFNGTDPTNRDSCLAIASYDGTSLTWAAKSYEVYEIQTTTNLAIPFSRYGNPLTPVSENGVGTVDAALSGLRFYRVEKVP